MGDRNLLGAAHLPVLKATTEIREREGQKGRRGKAREGK